MDRTKQKIEDLLEKSLEMISIKEMASFCSLMTSMRPALGDIARFRTRALLQIVDEAQKSRGWGARARLDSAAVSELKFWLGNLERCNGFPIRPKPGVVDIKQVKMVSDAGEHIYGRRGRVGERREEGGLGIPGASN